MKDQQKTQLELQRQLQTSPYMWPDNSKGVFSAYPLILLQTNKVKTTVAQPYMLYGMQYLDILNDSMVEIRMDLLRSTAR